MTARLVCGQLLEYEARSFVPEPGEVVPCRAHGYCAVRDVGAGGSDGGRESIDRRRQPESAKADLDDFLARTPVTTVHALGRRRFTLRILVAAQADGLLELDVITGEVRRRAG